MKFQALLRNFKMRLPVQEEYLSFLKKKRKLKIKDAIDIENVSGSVELDHVNFSYTLDKKLIEDLNLCVEPGKMIAIVGPTGCGKTTIINLLMRFYDVNSGKSRWIAII